APARLLNCSGSGILPRPSRCLGKKRGFFLAAAACGGGAHPCAQGWSLHAGMGRRPGGGSRTSVVPAWLESGGADSSILPPWPYYPYSTCHPFRPAATPPSPCAI